MFCWLNTYDHLNLNFFDSLYHQNIEFIGCNLITPTSWSLTTTVQATNSFIFSYFDYMFISKIFFSIAKPVISLFEYFGVELTLYLSFLFYTNLFNLSSLGLQDWIFMATFMEYNVAIILLDFVFSNSIRPAFHDLQYIFYGSYNFMTVFSYELILYTNLLLFLPTTLLFMLFIGSGLKHSSLQLGLNKLILFLYPTLINFRTSQDFLYFIAYALIFWLFILINSEDFNLELVELGHLYFIFIFYTCILVFFFQYSIHFFSFLEISLSIRHSSSWLFHQFIRDVSNTFALFLRIGLLIFRLNVYDCLDDFLDSYYIFVCDFDEDFLPEESFFFSSQTLLYSDNSLDALQSTMTELDTELNLYLIYYNYIGKFFFTFFFILEILFRLTLAFYIYYLIFLEIHNVIITFTEVK